jgi:hypothetical protein
MQNSAFLVNQTPYCVWEWDLHDRNMGFLNSIDHSYFEYVAQCHLGNLATESKHQAAVALRSAYHQGLETLFMLIGAAIQAPDCVVGWFQKCQPRKLREMVEMIERRRGHLPNKLGLPSLSWSTLSQRMLLFHYRDLERLRKTQELFAGLWQMFAHDFTDELSVKEYNSIKHGLRVRAGGCALGIAHEREYGVSPPENEIKLIGASEFGTSFFVAEPISGAPRAKQDPHFRVRRCRINWDAEGMAHALNLIALSIKNVVSFLRISNGADPKTVEFTRPSDDDYFHKPWQRSLGVVSNSIDSVVPEEEIYRASAEEILKRLEPPSANQTPRRGDRVS